MRSGPRNISTAMMRSFGSRADTVVVDEPLYAHYLAVTGIDHPGREEILLSQPTRWRDVAAALTGPVPGDPAVHYQKHMTHHLLPGIGRDWLGALTHAFLIRDPGHVVASYARVRGEPTLEDLGYPQQVEIYRAYGGPVVDAADVLRDPPGSLHRLCDALGIVGGEVGTDPGGDRLLAGGQVHLPRHQPLADVEARPLVGVVLAQPRLLESAGETIVR
jgi:hypothetical protein